MATANPTQSSTGFRVVTVGSGKTYATLTDFFNYLTTQNLITNQEILCAEVYDNQTISGRDMGPASANDNYYCLIRPVPGYSVNELDPSGALDYGTVGIEINISNNSPSKLRNGVLFRDFNIKLSGTNQFETVKFTKSNQTNSVSTLQGFDKCRILVQTPNAPTRAAFDVGDNGGIGSFTDSLIIFDTGTASPLAAGFDIRAQRLTLVRRGTTAGNAFGDLNGTGSVTDCIFSNMSATAIVSTATNVIVSSCISDNSNDQGKTGFVVNTSSPLLTGTTDFRPKSGGPAIGGASSVASAFRDIRNNNRGSSPDYGAAQLSILPPAPTGTITSQPAPDGQSLAVQFSTTGSPSSGSASLVPDTNNPNGAVNTTGTVTLDTNTGTATFTNIPPGNYTLLISVTAAGGVGIVSRTQPVSINSISGTPEGDAGSGSSSTVTSVSVSPATATGSTTFTATVSGVNSPSQSVTWSATAGSISSAGVFTAPAATGSVQTITVTATSIVDPTKSGTATVTIAASTGSTVTGVSVSPSTATVNGGSTRQFSATVSGTNSPSQAVSWTANGGSVSSAGLFTAPVATTSAQTFTVTATSVADGSKSGSATVTVPALAAATRTITMPLATGLDIFNQPIPAANLSGLSVAIYAQSTPGSASTVLYQTEAGTTNVSGVFSASFQTLLQAGALVLVVILMPNGDHFVGKVAIA